MAYGRIDIFIHLFIIAVMKRKINNRLIRSFKPCYDPTEVGIANNESLTIVEWIEKYRKTVKDPADVVWLICRNEFITDRDLRLFAVWCAREALKLVESPDERSIDAVDCAERYANGQATADELAAAMSAAGEAAWAARAAARAAAGSAAGEAAWAAGEAARAAAGSAAGEAAWAAGEAARAAAWEAARAAARAAAGSAAGEAAWAAGEAARAAAWAAAWEAAWSAAGAAAWEAAWAAQIDKLLTYFK